MDSGLEGSTLNRSILVQIDTDPISRFWMGSGTIVGPSYEVGKETYSREYAETESTFVWDGLGEVFDFSGYEVRSGRPEHRSTLTLSGIPIQLRRAYLQDEGPLRVETKWMFQPQGSEVWRVIENTGFVGQMSNVDMSECQIVIELETLQGDADRGRPRKWSHEDQRYRPGPTGWELSFSRSVQNTIFPISGGTELIIPASTVKIGDDPGEFTVATSSYTSFTVLGAGITVAQNVGASVEVVSQPRDIGLEYMRKLTAEGFGTTWPP